MPDELSKLAKQAASLDDAELYRRIGVLAHAIGTNSESMARPVDDVLVEARGEEADFIGIGRRIADKVNEQARDLVCGSGDTYKEERKKFEDAVKQGIDVVSQTVAAFLARTIV